MTVALARGAADAEKLRVKVEGLRGGIVSHTLGSDDLKRNVLSVLSIDEARGDKDLTEGRIRRLHAKAADEIREALAPFGYYRPVLNANLEKEGDTFVATYRIEPGPPLHVTSLALTVTGPGAGTQPFEQVARDFPLGEGDVLVQPVYDAGKKTFDSLASETGYLDAVWKTSEILIDRDAYTARITLHYDTGPRFVFGSTAFEQDVLDPDLLKGYVTWHEGDPIDTRQLLRLQNALGASTYFARVEIEAAREKADGLRVPILVHLEPARPWRFATGLGYGTDTGPRGSLAVDLRRVNRRGHRIETETKLSFLEQSATARYLMPVGFPRTDVLTWTVGFAHLRPRNSESRTFLTGPELTRVRGLWHQVFGLLFQRETYDVGLDSGVSELLTPTASFTRIRADDRIFTRNGDRFDLRLRGAVEHALSSATFGQAELTGKLIRPWGKKVRLIGRFDLGQTFTSQFRQLPPRIRFFAGGDASVRGYAYQQLGVRDEAGNVIGGRALQVASVEVEWMPIAKFGGIGFAAFYDAGNATDRFLSGPWKSGAGIGVRWRSPVGMVRIDVASAVSEPGHPFRFHVNIGPDL